MNKTYKTIEFDYVIKQVQSYCTSLLAKDSLASSLLYNDLDDLKQYQGYLKESMEVIQKVGRFPLASFEDIFMYLAKVEKSGVLTGSELLLILQQLKNCSELHQFISNTDLSIESVSDLIKELVYHKNLDIEISRCIDRSGKVDDNASPELLRIKRAITSTEASIRKKVNEMSAGYRDYLSQETIAFRNDRAVLPVKVAYKNKVKGIIHAISASGQTVFIEPEAIANMHHSLYQLESDANVEIERILKNLSQLVKVVVHDLRFNQDRLVYLDELFARAIYGEVTECIIPNVDNAFSGFTFIKARHPLINKEEVVANDIVLKDNKKMLLISGSNTGGKTVVLKTVGLLSVMALSGFALPCIEAKIPFFDQVLVDIGDEQSIEQSLSTFSSHMTRIANICQTVTNKSLVLLDELGSGTDPVHGESLAQAILMHLHQVQALTFVSTHFSKIREYAKQVDYITMGAVEFDQEKMLPTYRFLIDNIGQSYGIEIASRLGLPSSVIDNSYAIKDNNMSKVEHVMEQLQKDQDALVIKKDDLEKQLAETNNKINKYNRLLETIDKEKEKIIDEARIEANHYLDDAKNKVDKVVSELKQQATLKEHLVIDAKHQLDNAKVEKEKEVIIQEHVFKVDDRVVLNSMNREAIVQAISRKGELTLDMQGITINVKPQDVRYIGVKEKVKVVKSGKKPIKTANSQISYECNLIGMRFVEAMEELDKFIDSALVHNYSMVRVIHGMGTGVLRKGVRDFLQKHPAVTSFRDGGSNEGGLGATVVNFD